MHEIGMTNSKPFFKKYKDYILTMITRIHMRLGCGFINPDPVFKTKITNST
jgi:hypothetical protein